VARIYIDDGSAGVVKSLGAEGCAVPEIRTPQSVVRFEGFELDLRSGELRRDGGKTVRLSEQPFRILLVLLERPLQVVSREELRKKLWPNDTIVEFEHSISAAMNRLRQVLGDTAEQPRYIETLARRGYRWMLRVEWEPVGPSPPTFPVSQSSVSPEKLIGKKVSHYRVLELLGGGGMGVVYKAEDIKLGRAVALKFLPEELIKDPVALGRFEREARSASALDHPSICAIHEFEEHGGRPFIVMQLLEGQTVRERIAIGVGHGRAMPIDELIDLAIQVTDGLEAAHQKGIIHRDIKPANIFITNRGEAKILDFGLAKLRGRMQRVGITPGSALLEDRGSMLLSHLPTSSVAADPALSKPGQTMGTASYMSPEQVRCEELDGRTDLFSLGLVLYEMATSQQAFEGDTASVLHDAILHRTPTSARALNRHVPPRLEEIINKCLEKDRDSRYQFAGDLCADLKRLRSDGQTAIGVKSNRWTGLVGSKKTFAVLAVIFGVFAGAAMWLNFSSQPPKVRGSVQVTKDGLNKSSNLVTDGARLYFTEETPPGVFALAQVSANGGETSRLPVRLEFPQIYDISPTRSELLVSSGFATDPLPELQLWVVPIPTGPPRRVGDILAHSACWAADGLHIVYANGHDLYSARVDGSEIRKLATAPGVPMEMRSSPDGDRLRFTVFGELWDLTTAPSVWEITSDGKDLHRVLAEGCCGSWSADGKYYYFSASRADDSSIKNPAIWVHPEGGSIFHRESRPPVRLTSEVLSLGFPVPSIDGKRLFVVGYQGRVDLVRFDTKAKQLVPFLGDISAGEVDVSRDGEWVTYTDYPEGNVWRSKIDGSERLQLTFPPFYAREPRWAPDGKQIVFAWFQSKIFVVSANGGVPQQLMPEDKPDVAGAATWSPDGNSIVFGRWAGTEKGVYRLDLKTRQFSKLPGSDGLYSARLSPDGHYVAALSDKRHLKLYDFNTETWSELAQGNFFNNNWSHDSKYVYMEQVRQGEPMELVRVSTADRKLEHVINLKDITSPGWPLSLGRDDSPILMRDKGTQEIYALNLETF